MVTASTYFRKLSQTETSVPMPAILQFHELRIASYPHGELITCELQNLEISRFGMPNI